MIIGQRPDRGHTGQATQGRPQTDAEKGTFTLNSTCPVSGAGSGIVAGPDRVRRGQERETRGGGWGAGTQAGPGVVGATLMGGQRGGGG